MTNKVIVEVQHFHGCPNGPAMIKNVQKALKGLEDKVEYREILVDNNELAQKVKFLGSPTLLINGVDFEGREFPGIAMLNCRIYPNGVPAPDEIKTKIEKLLT